MSVMIFPVPSMWLEQGNVERAAEALAAEEKFGRAALLGSAETTFRDRYGIHLEPFNQARRTHAMNRARQEMDAETWQRASEEGQTMSLEEAISAALDEDVGDEPAQASRKPLLGSSDALTRRGA